MDTEVTQETSEPIKKNGKSEARPADKSTPDDRDPKFADWMEELFEGPERVQKIDVYYMLGRGKKQKGDLAFTRHFKPVEEKPSRREVVSHANEILHRMQTEADELHAEQTFLCEAFHPIRGGVFDRRSKTIQPSTAKLSVLGRGGIEVDEDGAVDPLGGDILRRRVEAVLSDDRFRTEIYLHAFSDLTRALVEENKSLRQQSQETMGGWLAMARQLNAAENNALDREFAREDRRMLNEVKKKGFGFVMGLLPGIVDKATGGAIKQAHTPESQAIDAIMDTKMGGLSAEEKAILFGTWTDAGECTSAGILTESQVRLIRAVWMEECDPRQIDRMLPGGPDSISGQQHALIMQKLKDPEKLGPLVVLMKNRMEEIAESRRKAAVTDGV